MEPSREIFDAVRQVTRDDCRRCCAPIPVLSTSAMNAPHAGAHCAVPGQAGAVRCSRAEPELDIFDPHPWAHRVSRSGWIAIPGC